MAKQGGETPQSEMLLGKQVAVVDTYSPALLYPIPRAAARESLGIASSLPFHGADLWHAYELSWLDAKGKPQVRVGRFHVPADSPAMVESKSFKLYLNSLNNTRLGSDTEVAALLAADLEAVVARPVRVELLAVSDGRFAGVEPPGDCLDDLGIEVGPESPSPALLRCAGGPAVEENLHSHLLRSLCPVTGQPDWATVWIHYRGPALDHASLLRYIVAFRRHQEFHEQCVERMFVDLQAVLKPELLELQAFYTRRGGLDINPYRSSEASGSPRPRMNRQ